MSFEQLGLSSETLQAIKDAGYDQPTPIQEKAIPYVLMGRDIMGVAQTGTGKTAGFTLPMIDILSSGRAKTRMPRSIILEPTRELASQVADSFEKYGKNSKLSMALLIGGESMKDQQNLLQRGVDVLIATPGRLLDLFDRGQILLADTKLLVIDEADRMLDMGFIPDVEKLVGLLPPLRQTLFFSATMAPEIRKLSEKFLNNPKEISVAPPPSAAALVTQRLLPCEAEPKKKRAALRELLKQEADEMQSALIFSNRKRDVATLQRSLERHGLNAKALHGDMAQPARMETLNAFKNGEIQILVCSDVAARGLDIPAVSHVFNFDVPTHAEDYVHRIGRTGRAGRSGKAYTLFLPSEKKYLDAVQKLIGFEIQKTSLSGEAPSSEKAKEEAQPEAAKTRRSSQRKTSQAKSRKPSGGKVQDDASKPQAEDKAAEVEAVEDKPVEEEAEKSAKSGKKPAAQKTSSRRSKSRKKEPELLENDESTSPFGEHTPAFLLRPVPQTASA
ncbi:DEAD/DEAH box helicase [Fodinicurvata sediminis]|uniref:DEAD/DEAH box helicase n=1 Tax=Fodinicurvata sediminis TaxID=1121832 RepID=UPI0003B46E35|nr:DEAD/DEAH box helicase [Fodinicurvata sediminis]